VRLAVTADLHWGISKAGDRTARALAAQVLDLAPDAFAIAGDVGEGARFRDCLRVFTELRCARLVVPGNHDLWTRAPVSSSLAMYEQRLPRTAAEEGWIYLDTTPYLRPDGREAVAGSINWYDYSFADPELAREIPNVEQMYREKRFPRGRHNDGRFVQLWQTDEAFTGHVVERFRQQLESLPASVERVVVVQHHPPVRELFYPTALESPEQRVWLAYTGNRRMQDLVLSDPRVTTILCGHTHAYCAAEVQGRRCRNIGGDYDFKRLLLLDTETGEEQWWEFR
jgi:3',5'-cyclic AMP phosphodiesterase CpdA